MSSAEPGPDDPGDQLSARVEALAASLAAKLDAGAPTGLTPEAIQALAAIVCRAYAANQEAGVADPIVSRQSGVTSTDVMIACSALLKAADLQVFELGMWSSWTGR
jgi:hypothetical protein